MGIKTVVHFAVREMGEVFALNEIINLLKGESIYWYVYIVPYNTDLTILNPVEILNSRSNVSIIQGLPSQKESIIFGFISDISVKCLDTVTAVIDIQEISACINYEPSPVGSTKVYDIVVSNIKLFDKNPAKECDPEIWQMLGNLPYTIAVVPRHPIQRDNYSRLPQLPKNVTLINKM